MREVDGKQCPVLFDAASPFGTACTGGMSLVAALDNWRWSEGRIISSPSAAMSTDAAAAAAKFVSYPVLEREPALPAQAHAETDEADARPVNGHIASHPTMLSDELKEGTHAAHKEARRLSSRPLIVVCLCTYRWLNRG